MLLAYNEEAEHPVRDECRTSMFTATVPLTQDADNMAPAVQHVWSGKVNMMIIDPQRHRPVRRWGGIGWMSTLVELVISCRSQTGKDWHTYCMTAAPFLRVRPPELKAIHFITY